jgi:hypothetical protein
MYSTAERCPRERARGGKPLGADAGRVVVILAKVKRSRALRVACCRITKIVPMTPEQCVDSRIGRLGWKGSDRFVADRARCKHRRQRSDIDRANGHGEGGDMW